MQNSFENPGTVDNGDSTFKFLYNTFKLYFVTEHHNTLY